MKKHTLGLTTAQPKSVQELQAEMQGIARKLDLDQDPAFVADYLKSQFIEYVLQAMEEKGVTRNELAQRLGKSRQYVSRVLSERANFTIETMAAISCALGCRLTIRMG